MAKTSKEMVSEERQRKAEYAEIRKILMHIVQDDAAGNMERIKAAELIYKMDSDGIPVVFKY